MATYTILQRVQIVEIGFMKMGAQWKMFNKLVQWKIRVEKYSCSTGLHENTYLVPANVVEKPKITQHSKHDGISETLNVAYSRKGISFETC